MCERAKTDAGFPKYPRLPVGECGGFERRDQSETADRRPPAAD